MSPWLLIFLGITALGGLLVLNGVGRTKSDSEVMLEEYRRLLEEARRTKPKSPENTEKKKA